HPGHLRLRAGGHRQGRQGRGLPPRHRSSAQVRRPPAPGRHRPGRGYVRSEQAPGDALMPLAVAALTFLLVVALIAGVTWSFEGTRRVRQRLATGPSAAGFEGDLLRAEPGGRKRGGPSRRVPVHDRVARLAEQAGYPGMSNDFFLYVSGAALLGFLLGWLRTGQMIWGIGAAVVFGVLPLAFLVWRRQKRMQQFEAQFPDGLDAMARAIRAGNALSTAVQLVAEEMPDPIGGEFRRVF